MKKIELLSPAGDFETLKIAIHAGADAVYLSGKNYGARKYAKNFNEKELEDAIKYAHLYGVKIYITVNTIIFENEVKEFLNYVTFLHKIGVDAIIMQDLGMIKLVKETLPNLEIHASTQCHNINNEGLCLLKDLGIKRVVLARELSKEEIDKLTCDIEKEVFIHGALCLSYSGQCYFSNFHGGRSGNRGECAGVCRLPYQLIENNNIIPTKGNYLLSMKDLCTLETITNLIKHNISSLKIEGRMKSPAYVGYVTKVYRNIIDNYYKNKKTNVSKTIINNLKVLYNREFTKGYLNNQRGIDVVNIKTPNHQGIPLGKVISYNQKKITIQLEEDLHQNDGIRFTNNKGMIVNYLYDKNNNLISEAKKGDIITLDNKLNINSSGEVQKTLDSNLTNLILNFDNKKIPISFKVKAILNKELEIEITDYQNKISIKDSKVLPSINYITTKDDIIKTLKRVGNTIFKIDNIDIELDNNVFIPLSTLNNIRRNLCEKLENKRASNKQNIVIKNNTHIKSNTIKTNYIIILIRNKTQLEYLINKDIIIVTDNYNLYKKYKNAPNLYYKIPRASSKLKDYNIPLVVSDLGSLYKYNGNLISSIYLNVTNSYSIKLIHDLGIKVVGISPEVEDNNLDNIINNYNNHYQDKPNIAIFIYGRIELMMTKYCLINTIINKNKKPCQLCTKNIYKLKSNDNIYPIITNNCINYILDSKNINKIDKLSYYKNLGINNYIISLYDESPSEIENILNKIKVS